MKIGPSGFWFILISYLLAAAFFGYHAAIRLITVSESKTATFGDALSTATFVAVAVSSLFYSRKLYKDAFNGLGNPDERPLAQSATIAYYMLRPIFAVSISALFVAIFYAAIRALSEGHVGISGDFVFFSAISASILSISTGASVQRLEEIARSGHSFFRFPV